MGSVTPALSTRRTIRSEDISALTQLLAGTDAKLIKPGETGYDAAIARWSMAASKPAGLVVQPSTSQEVAIALKYASDNNIDVSVKGGGHSTAGVSSTDGGLMFYLESMRYVKLEELDGHKVFRIGGGASWGDVDNEGVKHGLHTVGGTVADTGVGGLTLGGGYGWLSGTYGLTIDCLVEATIVLANGEIKRVSEKENPDLFWAIRGAGQNFGVATEFVIKAYPQKDVWVGLVLFPPEPEIVEKVVNVLNDIYAAKEDGRTKHAGKTCGGLGFASPPPAEGKILMFVSIIYNGSEADGKELWKDLLAIGPVMSTMAMQPYPVANQFLAPPIGLRSSMKGASFVMPMRPAFVQDVMKEYTTFFQKGPAERGVTLLMWELFDRHEVATRTAGSFANRGYHMNALIAPIWTKPELDDECRQWARDVNSMFKSELEKHGVDTSPAGDGGAAVRGKKGAVMMYGNYDQYDERSKDVFGDNYPELQKIKAKYDPGNVFNKLFPIVPAA